MVSQKRISEIHVPRTKISLTDGFAASCAAGVYGMDGMDFSYTDSLRNKVDSKGTKSVEGNLTSGYAARCAAGVKGINFSCVENTRNNVESEFEQNASATNWYGIFQDEIPWLQSALRVYSDIQNLCRNNCDHACGVCRIKKRIDLKVNQMLNDYEFSESCGTKGSGLAMQEQVMPRKETQVAEKKCVQQQHDSIDNLVNHTETRNSRPMIKFCKYCGLKHRLGTRFCRSFAKRCDVCKGMNHHASVCWFKESGAKSHTNLEPNGKAKSSLERIGSKEAHKEYSRYRRLNKYRSGNHQTLILKNENDLHRLMSSATVGENANEKIGKTPGSLRILQNSCEGFKLKTCTDVVDIAKIIPSESLQESTSIAESSKATMKTDQISDKEPDIENLIKERSGMKSREKVLSEQNSLMNPEEALEWINSKLKRNYGSLSKLKNGRGLGDLITNILGYTVNSKLPWDDIEDILIMADLEKDVSAGKLKCNDIEEITKFTSLLKCAEEELQSKKNHGGRSKGNCCN